MRGLGPNCMHQPVRAVTGLGIASPAPARPAGDACVKTSTEGECTAVLRRWILGLVVLAAACVLSARAAAQLSEPLSAQGSPSPARAQAYSVLFTVAPIAAGIAIPLTTDATTTSTIASGTLLWSGALFGPALGYRLGGAGRYALPGLILRSACFALAWAQAPTHDFNDGFLPNPQLDDLGFWGLAVLAITISDVADIVRVPRVVRRARSSESEGRSAVLPFVDPAHHCLGVIFSWNGRGAHAF